MNHVYQLSEIILQLLGIRWILDDDKTRISSIDIQKSTKTQFSRDSYLVHRFSLLRARCECDVGIVRRFYPKLELPTRDRVKIVFQFIFSGKCCKTEANRSLDIFVKIIFTWNFYLLRANEISNSGKQIFRHFS